MDNPFVSIVDYGATSGDVGNQTAAIQAAIDSLQSTGGSVIIPPGTYRFEQSIIMRSGIELRGVGHASRLHFVNTTRSDAIRGIGTQASPLTDMRLYDFALYGDRTFDNPEDNNINGGGVNFVFVNDTTVSYIWLSGFSDGGIAILNGNYNDISHCRVRYTAQGISFNANAIDCFGNVAVGNIISDTGTYNGLHLEGNFGAQYGNGQLYGTVLSGNTIVASREAGINIELAPQTSCTGNTVRNAGYGATQTNMGLKAFGSYQSSIGNNVIVNSNGYGLWVGANCGQCALNGNVTTGNGGSLLVTDNNGTHSTLNVVVVGNSLTEGAPVLSGDVSIIT